MLYISSKPMRTLQQEDSERRGRSADSKFHLKKETKFVSTYTYVVAKLLAVASGSQCT